MEKLGVGVTSVLKSSKKSCEPGQSVYMSAYQETYVEVRLRCHLVQVAAHGEIIRGIGGGGRRDVVEVLQTLRENLRLALARRGSFLRQCRLRRLRDLE